MRWGLKTRCGGRWRGSWAKNAGWGLGETGWVGISGGSLALPNTCACTNELWRALGVKDFGMFSRWAGMHRLWRFQPSFKSSTMSIRASHQPAVDLYSQISFLSDADPVQEELNKL